MNADQDSYNLNYFCFKTTGTGQAGSVKQEKTEVSCVGSVQAQLQRVAVRLKLMTLVMKKVKQKTAEAVAVANATTDLLKPYQDQVLTITADYGKEFVQHEKVVGALKCGYCSVHPCSSLERGLNENTSGLFSEGGGDSRRLQNVT